MHALKDTCHTLWPRRLGARLGVVDVVTPGQRDHARADEAGQVIYVPVHHLRARLAPLSVCRVICWLTAMAYAASKHTSTWKI